MELTTHNNGSQDVSNTVHITLNDNHSPARALCMDIQAMTHFPMAQIAKLCDIPLSTFYRMAMGTTQNPLYKNFDKLLRTYFMLRLNQSTSSTELN